VNTLNVDAASSGPKVDLEETIQAKGSPRSAPFENRNGAADLLAGFRRELVEKINDLLDDFLFGPCGISGSTDFGMATTYVSRDVPRIVELAANLAF
jgi:hypothetical protein